MRTRQTNALPPPPPTRSRTILIRVQLCLDYCTDLGAAFMATQFGFECWCSADDDLDYERHYELVGEDAVCDAVCTGDEVHKFGCTGGGFTVCKQIVSSHLDVSVYISITLLSPLVLAHFRHQRLESLTLISFGVDGFGTYSQDASSQGAAVIDHDMNAVDCHRVRPGRSPEAADLWNRYVYGVSAFGTKAKQAFASGAGVLRLNAPHGFSWPWSPRPWAYPRGGGRHHHHRQKA